MESYVMILRSTRFKDDCFLDSWLRCFNPGFSSSLPIYFGELKFANDSVSIRCPQNLPLAQHPQPDEHLNI